MSRPLYCLAMSLALAGAPLPASAEDTVVTMYKSATCGCCKKWGAHMEANGFKVESHDLRDLSMVKSISGVRPTLASCHTALVDGYVIEGHVPAEDVRRLLKERPANVLGLAAPGMPAGSPGMEGPRKDHYKVLSFDKAGKTQVFAEH